MAASRTTDPLSGAPLELRDSRLASNTFRLGTNSWDGVPKPKFLFYVRFMRSQSTGGTGSSSSTVDWSKGVGLVVKNVDRPKVAFDTQTLNQYNRKRVVQSRVEYNPLSIKFHDTVDNKVFNMFEEYFRFYYGDPRATSDVNWQWDQYAQQLKTPGSGNWGFNPPAVDPNFSYFFSRVEIYQFFGGKFARFDIINPKIVSFDPDELDYANGSVSHEITMNLAFEGIVYQGNNQDLSSNSDLLEEMKLNGSDYYLPAQSGTNAGGTTATSATYTPTSGSTFDNGGALALGGTNSLPTGVLSTSLSNTGNVAAPAIAAPPLMSNIGGNLYYGNAASTAALNSDGSLQRVLNTGIIGSTNFSSDPINAAQRLVWGLL
jgi:hypothetical protein